MTIQVRKFNVATDCCDVGMEVIEFDSIEDMLTQLEEEFGEEINDVPIRELWDDDDLSIVIEGDVWFGKWEVIVDE